MNKLPPTVPDGLHPDDIIPQSLYHDFLSHYRVTYKCDTTDQFNAAVKNINPQTRNAIAKIYNMLDENGWSPAGFDENNKIKWRYRVSIPQDLTGLENIKTADHAGNSFRRLLGGIGKRVDSLPEWEKEMCR